MSLNKNMFTSASCEWETPAELVADLERELLNGARFDLDPCCRPETCKALQGIYPDNGRSGLTERWRSYGYTVFMNPPYGRQIGEWMRKALTESMNGMLVVCLVHARTDTNWFHKYVYHKAEIRFLRGRIRFLRDGKPADRPTFPSMLVIYRPTE